MEKKLVLMAMLLFAICFAGFAQEAFSVDPSQYVAKAEEEKEFTLIVAGQVKIDGKWVLKRERFVIIARRLGDAESAAKNKFSYLYTGDSYAFATTGVKRIKSVVVTCESTRDACDYNF